MRPRLSVSRALSTVTRGFVRRGAADVTVKDVDSVDDRAAEIRETFKAAGPLRRFVTDAALLAGLVRDYRRERYRDVPFRTVAAAVFALLYVLSPVDLIPDFLPVVGYLDDAAVVGLCLSMLEHDLARYKAWRESGPGR